MVSRSRRSTCTPRRRTASASRPAACALLSATRIMLRDQPSVRRTSSWAYSRPSTSSGRPRLSRPPVVTPTPNHAASDCSRAAGRSRCGHVAPRRNSSWRRASVVSRSASAPPSGATGAMGRWNARIVLSGAVARVARILRARTPPVPPPPGRRKESTRDRRKPPGPTDSPAVGGRRERCATMGQGCPGRGSNPHPCGGDFKSPVSTGSTTRAGAWPRIRDRARACLALAIGAWAPRYPATHA